MFNLFRKKPILADLIPEGFVDIHSHILPGIDDGAKNILESKKLISEMKKLGFGKIIGTPHTYPGVHNNTNSKIESSFKSLLKEIKDKELISYASEYLIDVPILKAINKKNLLVLKDNYILIEMSYVSEPNFLNEFIFELQNYGYKPILAHPERYRFWHNKFFKFSELKKRGVKFQINLLSVTDYYGSDIRMISDKLLKRGLIDYVGSDIHNISHVRALNNTYPGKNFKVKINCLNELKEAISSNSYFF